MIGADKHRVGIPGNGGTVPRKKLASFSDRRSNHALFVERLVEGIVA